MFQYEISSSEKLIEVPFGNVALYTVFSFPDFVTTLEPFTVKKLCATVNNKLGAINVAEPVPSGVKICVVAWKFCSPFGAFFTVSLGFGKFVDPLKSTFPTSVRAKSDLGDTASSTALIMVFPKDNLLTYSPDQLVSLTNLLIERLLNDTILAFGKPLTNLLKSES